MNKNLIFNQILEVNYDGFSTYYHKNFKRDIFYQGSYSWKKPINYYVEKNYMKDNVRKAIYLLQNNTCITFEEQQRFFNYTQGLIFVEASSCFSYYGLQYTVYSQNIWLSSGCSKDVYVILHEIGHALGLTHEHARMDRDKFIDIDFSQLDDHGRENFRIRNNTTYYRNYSTGYDYASLMHYGQYDFGSYWKWLFGYPVMKSKLYEQYTWMMGQREKATFNDYKQINLAHCNWCGWVDNSTGKMYNTSTKCKNSGYPDFRNCSRCICPTGYKGENCTEIEDSDRECGNTTFIANETMRTIILGKKMNCYIKIKPKKYYTNVEFKVLYVNAPPYKNDICVESSVFK